MANLPEDLLDRIKQLERLSQRTAISAATPQTPAAWQSLTLGAGISAQTGSTPQCRTRSSVLTVQGAVTTAAGIADGAVLANLPTGIKPLQQVVVPAATPNTTAARVEIDTDGSIRYHGATAQWVAVNFTVPLG
jgi:hypothetical protein